MEQFIEHLDKQLIIILVVGLNEPKIKILHLVQLLAPQKIVI